MGFGQTTIDITDAVEKLRSTFVDWAVAAAFTEELAAVPELAPFLALPIVSDIDKAAIRAVLDWVTKKTEMQAFFFNTVIRKSAQAQDFIDAVNAVGDLPKDASDATYLQKEKARALAFSNFVRITN